MRLWHGVRPGGEGVALVVLHAGKRVVHVRVARLVGAHGEHEVAHGGVRVEAPVLDGDVGRRRVGPLGQAAGVDVVQQVRVCPDGLLLEIADHAVAVRRREEVAQEEEVAEDALRREHQAAHD